ncbi:glycosyltransferase [Prevotella sp. OH937_COT-195]|uniref:glycosyltransferase n=1 Tax=Prevotella sp. OH937_COT-195 TaxID=2491051 RepID=UPI000F655A0F|nr:glycosyltransferase [Prevotella sp. OH937_COT-195]RRD02526.1 glycosyltransferase [Prevotella sp. OH937_COT-195]
MKVLIVNTSDASGGASTAARRLAEALNNNGVEARMLVRERLTETPFVELLPGRLRQKWNFLWERMRIFVSNMFSRDNLFTVSIANTGQDITRTKAFRDADIIHLHWVNQGMLSLGDMGKILRSGKPVVWTMHDMWQLTAICHYAHECRRFVERCGRCPFLRFSHEKDLSRKVFVRKQKMLSGTDVSFVAVSTWLQREARQSALLADRDVRVVPNVLSLSRFRLFPRDDSRRRLGIRQKYVVMFGAARIDNKIKGFNFLREAIRHIIDNGMLPKDDLCLLLFGGIKDESVLHDFPIHYIYDGYVKGDEKLSMMYSAANCVVSSSLYETFGQTLIEALACGCLPVTFDNSGQTDIVRHRENGYLARWKDSQSLAEGIVWAALDGLADRMALRRDVIDRYSESVVAQQYIDIYKLMK